MKYPFPAVAALAALAVAAPWPAAAQTTAPVMRQAAHIDVSGQGSVDRMPDQVVVTFSIIANADVAARATSAANVTYDALVARMRALGIDAASIKTLSFDMSYNPRPPQPNPQASTRYGFIVTRGVAITTTKTDQAGAIVDAGIAAGATNVDGVAFGFRDPRAAYNAALSLAVADAEDQARALATAAHQRIIRVVEVRAGSGPTQPVPLRRFTTDSFAATQIPSSALTVNATVGITYEVGPA